jgi:hypothetical protein
VRRIVRAQDLNAIWCPTCPTPQQNPGAYATVQALSTSNQTTSLSDALQFTVGH